MNQSKMPQSTLTSFRGVVRAKSEWDLFEERGLLFNGSIYLKPEKVLEMDIASFAAVSKVIFSNP